MKLPLVEGIFKCAFTINRGTRELAPWGGTTKDVGFDNYTGPLGVSLAGGALGAKAISGSLMGKAFGPASGITEAAYGMTYGKKKAREAGAAYGKQLGQHNPFLAARLK